MALYKKSDAYIQYAQGVMEGSVVRRHPRLPPFETNENGLLKVAPGELFCRVFTINGTLCKSDRRFSNASHLRYHINRHPGAEIEAYNPNPKGPEANLQLRAFYRRLIERVHGQTSSDAEDFTTPPTTGSSIQEDSKESIAMKNDLSSSPLTCDLDRASGGARDTNFGMLRNRFIADAALPLSAFMEDVFDLQLTLHESGELESSPIHYDFDPFQLWCSILAERKEAAK